MGVSTSTLLIIINHYLDDYNTINKCMTNTYDNSLLFTTEKQKGKKSRGRK